MPTQILTRAQARFRKCCIFILMLHCRSVTHVWLCLLLGLELFSHGKPLLHFYLCRSLLFVCVYPGDVPGLHGWGEPLLLTDAMTVHQQITLTAKAELGSSAQSCSDQKLNRTLNCLKCSSVLKPESFSHISINPTTCCTQNSPWALPHTECCCVNTLWL